MAAARRSLTELELDALSAAASRTGGHGHRDKTLIMIAYRYGLRVSELVSLRWDMLDLKKGFMHITRLKRDVPSAQPLRGPELQALRRLSRETAGSPYVFVSERQRPLTTATVHKIVAHAGRVAGLPFRVQAHMLRRSAEFDLAGDAHDTRAVRHLGHGNTRHATRYAKLAADPSRDFRVD